MLETSSLYVNRAQNHEPALEPRFAKLSKQGSTVDHDIYFPLIASKSGNQTDTVFFWREGIINRVPSTSIEGVGFVILTTASHQGENKKIHPSIF